MDSANKHIHISTAKSPSRRDKFYKIDNSENQKPKAYKIRIEEEPKQTNKNFRYGSETRYPGRANLNMDEEDVNEKGECETIESVDEETQTDDELDDDEKEESTKCKGEGEIETEVNEEMPEGGLSEEDFTSEQLKGYICNLQNEVIAELCNVLKLVEDDENSLDGEITTITEQIESQCDEIKSHVDKSKNDMLEKLSGEKHSRAKKSRQKKEALTKQKEELEKLLNDCRFFLMRGGEDMIKFYADKCPRLTQFCFDYTASTTSYEAGMIDIPEIRRTIGVLNLGTQMKGPPLKTTLITFPDDGLYETTAEVVLRFNTYNIIQDIRTTSAGDAWITDEDSHYIVKYNSTGKVLKTLNSHCYNECFVINKDGDFLVCNYWDKRIMRVTEKDEVSILIDELPAPPTGICINHEDNIVICMKDHPYIPIYSADGKTKLHQMDLKEPRHMGDEVDEVFLTDGNYCYKRAIFQIDSPYRIFQNRRRDYIIVDGKYRYQIVCLDQNGKFRWKYVCQQLEDVYPYNICCTQDDDILVADVETQRFHVINQEGQFMKYILYDQLGLDDAWSMSVDNTGRLWTGQDDGIVNIMNLALDPALP